MYNIRDFKGIWIPKEIWLSKELNVMEKVLLSEIHSLDNEETNGCVASNQYLSEFLGIRADSVSSYISHLKELGYIEQVKFDGRKRIIKTNFQRQTRDISQSRLGENPKAKKSTPYNIIYNKEYNLLSENKEFSQEDITETTCQEIKSEWNKLADKYNFPKINKVTAPRLTKYKIRQSEGMNWSVIEKHLKQSFIPSMTDSWFNFDWLVKNDTNWLKLIEGNYKQSQPKQQNNAAALKTYTREQRKKISPFIKVLKKITKINLSDYEKQELVNLVESIEEFHSTLDMEDPEGHEHFVGSYIGFAYFISTPERLIERYVKYLEMEYWDWKDLNVKLLKIDGKIWQKFIRDFQDSCQDTLRFKRF